MGRFVIVPVKTFKGPDYYLGIAAPVSPPNSAGWPSFTSLPAIPAEAWETSGSIVVAGRASAPPYALRRTAHRSLKPASVLQVPAGTFSVASGDIGLPLGVVTIPTDGETFAGATDTAISRLQP